MKWVVGGLVGLALILACVVGGWYVIGGRPFEFQRTVIINAPAKQVFATLSDPQLQGRWMSGVKEITPLTDGETKVGSKSKILIEENGRTLELTDEVLEFTPNRLLVVRLDGDTFSVTNRFELTGQNKQTSVKQTLTGTFHGTSRFAAPFAGGAIEQKMAEDLSALQRGLEQQQQMNRLQRSRNR